MNDHWFDKDGYNGMSVYFWKYKYPCILEATGHSEKEIEDILLECPVAGL